MGCRPQIVLPYLLRYSVNALGSTCNHVVLHTVRWASCACAHEEQDCFQHDREGKPKLDMVTCSIKSMPS